MPVNGHRPPGTGLQSPATRLKLLAIGLQGLATGVWSPAIDHRVPVTGSSGSRLRLGLGWVLVACKQ